MRGSSGFGPQPIAFGDAVRWCDEHEIEAPDERMLFCDAVRALDRMLFELVAEKSEKSET